MKNKELLPCPFCGGEVTISYHGNWYWITSDIHAKNGCHCRVFMETDKEFAKDDIKTRTEQREKLIKKWNTRTNKIPVGNGENYEVTHNV